MERLPILVTLLFSLPCIASGAVTCEQIESCKPAGADPGQNPEPGQTVDIEAKCKELSETKACIDKALADCRARSVMSEEQIKMFMDLSSTQTAGAQQMCDGIAGSPNNKCGKMELCMKNVPHLGATTSLSPEQLAEMCGPLKPASKCYLEAMEDCQAIGMFNATMVKGIKTQMMAQLSICPGGDGMSVHVDGAGHNVSGTYATDNTKPEDLPEEPKCQDLLTCLRYLGAVQENSSQACKVMEKGLACVEPAFADCSGKKVPQAEVTRAKSVIDQAKEKFKMHCPTEQAKSQDDRDGATAVQASLLTLTLAFCVLAGLNF